MLQRRPKPSAEAVLAACEALRRRDAATAKAQRDAWAEGLRVPAYEAGAPSRGASKSLARAASEAARAAVDPAWRERTEARMVHHAREEVS